jgi:hypothetical protein
MEGNMFQSARPCLDSVRTAFAAAVLLAVAADAARPDAAAPARLQIRLRERVTAAGDAAPMRGRFRLRIRGTTSAPPTASLSVRLGDLTIDVPLRGVRMVQRGAARAGGVRARVAKHGPRISVDASGLVREGLGSALAARVLEGCGGAESCDTSSPYGLFGGELSLDGERAAFVVGVVGRVKVADSTERRGRRLRLRLNAMGICPDDAQARPAIAFAPSRTWDGRMRGAALAVGPQPSLAYSWSGGQAVALEPADAEDAVEVGDAARVADGVSSLVLPTGTVHLIRFDAAAQSPPGPQTFVVRASQDDGRGAAASLHVTAPDADPPLLVAAQGQVLEVRADGRIWAWGYNGSGEVGDGTYLSPLSPVPLDGPVGVTSVAAGFDNSLAVDGDGRVWVWGDWSTTREIGNGAFEDFSAVGIVPTLFPGLTNIVAVASGMWEEGAFALDAKGRVWALGDDTLGGHPFHPRRVVGLPPCVAISQTVETAIALDRAGRVWNIEPTPQYVDGVLVSSDPTPVLVDGLPTVRSISAGAWGVALALDADGSVWSFGPGAPTRVALPRAAVLVSAGDGYYGAVLDDGTAWTWGGVYTSDDGTQQERAPARVRNFVGVTGLWVSGYDSLAVDRFGATWAWRSGDWPPGAESPRLVARPYRPGHAPVNEDAVMYRMRARRARR